MKVLRTSDDRFAGLPDFGYPPRYADVDGLRLAYVETGPADGEPVLLPHGEPSWPFLYRRRDRRVRPRPPHGIGAGA
jgi:haloalkane dehalogenase